MTSYPNLKCVIFDWVGTALDYGAQGGLTALRAAFQAHGVDVAPSEILAYAGASRYKQIHGLLFSNLSAARQWEDHHGAPPTEADVDALYNAYIEQRLEAIDHHSRLIPGTAAVVDTLREEGLAVASCTDEPRAVMDALAPLAADQGFAPDIILTPDDVPAARPAPWMIIRAVQELNVYPMRQVVKVGDTPLDLDEGLNAGVWTIGVARTGSSLGLTPDEMESTKPSELESRVEEARNGLRLAGAHYVIDHIGELPRTLEGLDVRINRGGRP